MLRADVASAELGIAAGVARAGAEADELREIIATLRAELESARGKGDMEGGAAGEFILYSPLHISCESCSQFDSPP